MKIFIPKELLAKSTDPSSSEKGILMIKHFKDGSFYEDYLRDMLMKTVNDYGFDGIQLADGISSPRNAIWFADFSDDITEQSGIDIPGSVDRISYIQTQKRQQWIDFYRRRLNSFLTKIIKALKANGTLVAVNSAWTRDPVEALYRYGADYSAIEEPRLLIFRISASRTENLFRLRAVRTFTWVKRLPLRTGILSVFVSIMHMLRMLGARTARCLYGAMKRRKPN